MQQQQKHHQQNWSSSLIAVVAFFDNLWKINVITNWGLTHGCSHTFDRIEVGASRDGKHVQSFAGKQKLSVFFACFLA